MTGTPRRKTFLEELQEAKRAKRKGVQGGENNGQAGTGITEDREHSDSGANGQPGEGVGESSGGSATVQQLSPFRARLAELRNQRNATAGVGESGSGGALGQLESEASGGHPKADEVHGGPSSGPSGPEHVTPGVAANQPSSDTPEFDSGLSEHERFLDRFIDGLDVVDCYNRWSGKSKINPGPKRESIKCSCPDPGHPDKNPSAWMNRDKNVGYCSGCDKGFDLWDIAAWRFGYPVPGYKVDKEIFRKLRDDIVGDFGFTKQRIGRTTVYAKSEEETAEEPTQQPPITRGPLSLVPPLMEDEEPAQQQQTVSLDWRQVVAPDTFLDAWMKATTTDTCPEEFHLFTGLMALGFAVGRNRALLDEPEVIPNIYVCLVGKSGTGKSRAKRHLKKALAEALPFNDSDPFPIGTKQVGTPGSGEAIVKELNHEVEDPSGAKRIQWPIRGYVDFDELSTLIAKGARVGSSLKPILMELYDAPHVVSNVTVTGGRVFARQPFTQVMTTTQNKSIRGVLDTKDDAAGFINRWVFVTGPNKPPLAINTNQVDLTRPIQVLKSVHAWAINPGKITFTPSALKKFSDFILQRVIPAKDKAEETSDIFNRMDLLLKKILVLLACNEKKDVVDDGIVDKMMMMYPYLREVYGVVDVEMAKTVAGELGDRVIEIINAFYNKHKKFPTAREILLGLAPKQRDKDSLNKTLKTLVDLGIILLEEPKSGQRGRPGIRYGVGG